MVFKLESKAQNLTNRNLSFDVLRAICCMLVVLLHTCGLFTKDYAKQFNYPNYFYSVANFYLFFTRIAVPCFVMMGGVVGDK